MRSKKERSLFIKKKLKSIYPKPDIPLSHVDPYTLLIAVLLSAQCTDKRVNQVTPKLFSKANSPHDMIKLSIAEIENIIRPCGLAPRKAKAIFHLSQILINKHKGCVPKNIEELEELPGVGHKTASVVMVQAFNIPAFPVDTHIHRLSQRWGLSSGKNVEQTEKDLKSQFPKKDWGRLHLQMIYYGREFCTARGCNGMICEICKTCYPNRKKPLTTKKA